MKKIIGKVTAEECAVISNLFNRRNGLAELARVLTADDKKLYEQLINDMAETGTKFTQWWDEMAKKYNWERQQGARWEIDFETCEITLSDEE